MKKALVALFMLFGLASLSVASDITIPASNVINAVLALTQNVDLDLNYYHVDDGSIQVNYSSANPSAVTFRDGTPGTGNITIANITGLTTTYATNKITIASNAGVAGSILTINGYPFTEGKNWNYNATYASMTATNLTNALNSAYSGSFISTNNTTGTVVYSTAATYGSAQNSITLVSSTQTALTVNAGTFTGGQDNQTFKIGGTTLMWNRDIYPGATTTTAATALTTALNALGDFLANSVANVVYSTTNFAGANANYPMATSTASLTLSGAALTGGTNPDFTVTLSTFLNNGNQALGYAYMSGMPTSALNTIYKAPTSLGTAFPLLLTKTAGTIPLPLVVNTTYYASNLTATSFQLSDTSTGAVAGLFLTMSTITAGGGGTFILTPLALTGTPVVTFQVSDDDVNFTNLWTIPFNTATPAQATFSFASPYTAGSVFYNLPENLSLWRWLRLAYAGTTGGGTNVQYIINGKRK
jgi:hypothetical protein